MCEDPTQKKIIRQEIKSYKDMGNLKKIEQEYNGMFTVDEEAFFENAHIEKGINKDLDWKYEEQDVPCSIGIDYGGVNAETAITVVGQYKEGLRLLFKFSRADFDYNKLMDRGWEHSISSLFKRYNVYHVVVDDCSMGVQCNKWLETEGYPVLKFNFRSDAASSERNRGYYIFRSYLTKGHIQYPNDKKLTSQMKTIQEKIGRAHV